MGGVVFSTIFDVDICFFVVNTISVLIDIFLESSLALSWPQRCLPDMEHRHKRRGEASSPRLGLNLVVLGPQKSDKNVNHNRTTGSSL